MEDGRRKGMVVTPPHPRSVATATWRRGKHGALTRSGEKLVRAERSRTRAAGLHTRNSSVSLVKTRRALVGEAKPGRVNGFKLA